MHKTFAPYYTWALSVTTDNQHSLFPLPMFSYGFQELNIVDMKKKILVLFFISMLVGKGKE
jgi:hypothetical protein